jgi:hypothetical protein
MSIHTVRDRLVLPVAAFAALSSVTSVQPSSEAASRRIAEVPAIRLQAEATTLVSGIGAGAVAALSPVAHAAATANSSTYNPNYTVFDNFLWSLPPNIQKALLPVAYAVAWVVGAVIGIVRLIAAPFTGLPAAALPTAPRAASTTPEAPPAHDDTPATASQATTAIGPGTPRTESGAPSSAPGVTRKANSVALDTAVATVDNTPADTAPRNPGRAQTRAAVETAPDPTDGAAPSSEPSARPRGRSATGGSRDASASPAAATRSAR